MFLDAGRQAAAVRHGGAERPRDRRARARLRCSRWRIGEHGKLPWSSLFGDAERTADEGFVVSPRLGRISTPISPRTARRTSLAYFSQARRHACSMPAIGSRNPAYADFLGRLAAQGPAALYAGSTAARIVARTRAAPLGGSMTMADLANYRPVKREPLCRPYRVYCVCAPPPPASGVGLLELLGLLERTDIAARGPERSAGLVPVRRGQPADVRRPRPLCRRSRRS